MRRWGVTSAVSPFQNWIPSSHGLQAQKPCFWVRNWKWTVREKRMIAKVWGESSVLIESQVFSSTSPFLHLNRKIWFWFMWCNIVAARRAQADSCKPRHRCFLSCCIVSQLLLEIRTPPPHCTTAWNTEREKGARTTNKKINKQKNMRRWIISNFAFDMVVLQDTSSERDPSVRLSSVERAAGGCSGKRQLLATHTRHLSPFRACHRLHGDERYRGNQLKFPTYSPLTFNATCLRW